MKKYEKPVIAVTEFTNESVITLSGATANHALDSTKESVSFSQLF